MPPAPAWWQTNANQRTKWIREARDGCGLEPYGCGHISLPDHALTPGFSGRPDLGTSKYLESRAPFLHKITQFPTQPSSGPEGLA